MYTFSFSGTVLKQPHAFCHSSLEDDGCDVPAYRCSVQRVAKRARVLSPAREALLNDIEFDWTCADALS